jgi:hypothetical protein
MSALRSHELALISDGSLLLTLTNRERRPNLLVACAPGTAGLILPLLNRWCLAPVRRCALPGQLRLPADRKGTLVLERVETLTLRQQINLYDWLTAGHGSPQVVSLTEQTLEPLVAEGAFLEALFYRLNMIRLDTLPAHAMVAAD